MKKICVVINSRANYGRVKSFMRAVDARTDLELQVVVGASGMLYRFGNVKEVLVQDGFKVDAELYNVVEGDKPVAMAISAGLAGIELSGTFSSLEPDLVLVVADRYEQMAIAVTASFMNIPVAHLQGGELTGSIDESVRHAISKLSHIHFPATQASADRLIRMGETPESIHVVGCPSIDVIADAPQQKPENLFRDGVGEDVDPSKPYIVVSQHPVTTEFGGSYGQVDETLRAVREVALTRGVQVVWLWPNVDAGSDSISKRLREFRESGEAKSFHFFRNFSPEDYIAVVRDAECLVGNSSSGIREASFLGVPSVNIGSRQSGRERAENVQDVGYDKDAIALAIMRQIDHGPYASSDLYGVGNAGEKMARIIAKTKVQTTKRFFDTSLPN